MKNKRLCVVMPVYNEEESISVVINEWEETLRKVLVNESYIFCIINDGSKDNTLSIIQNYENKIDEILLIDKENTGHGDSCILGYKIAIDHKCEWVLQIDSDGQCDPKYFEEFWDKRREADVIFGNRTKREDGRLRKTISTFVSISIFLSSLIWIKDANVPYRLINHKVLKSLIEYVPNDFYLANVFLSLLLTKYYDITWIQIIFRERYGGKPSMNLFSLLIHGVKLIFQTFKSVLTLPKQI